MPEIPQGNSTPLGAIENKHCPKIWLPVLSPGEGSMKTQRAWENVEERGGGAQDRIGDEPDDADLDWTQLSAHYVQPHTQGFHQLIQRSWAH